MILVALLVATTAAQTSRPTVYRQPKFGVQNTSKIVYGQGQQCAADDAAGESCRPTDLLLDNYSPTQASGLNPKPRPAIIMVHGGGWTQGSRTDAWAQASSEFFASRGFECFSITYRLANDVSWQHPQGSHGSYPNWSLPDKQTEILEVKAYPATRDLKAAIRFVRANAKRFNVDPERIALSGGSAGAISAVAAGVVDEADYKEELLATDSTLATTYLNTSSAVQCVISHWGAGFAVQLVQEADPSNRTRYSNRSSPIIEFHGDKDTSVPFASALAVEAAYRAANSSGNLAYEMHVLEGWGHASWCYGCSNPPAQHKKCIAPPGCHAMDIIALPFVAKHLDLDLEEGPPGPAGFSVGDEVIVGDVAYDERACITRVNSDGSYQIDYRDGMTSDERAE
eukprot:COSAG05_NODE_4706_length_1403_cov_2.184816_1_plen_396_part_01